MIVIADCGGTKSDWILADGIASMQRMHTLGINPFSLPEADIAALLGPVVEAVGQMFTTGDYLELFFYGAGCNAVGARLMQTLLQQAFAPFHPSLHVHSDLLGAARALCQRAEGVACILGTGSNSCLYDGTDVVANTPPLGYILGDEGSGSDLGKTFLHLLLKGQLPSAMREEFYATMGMTYAQIISRIYQQPCANRFLASLAPFIGQHLDNEQVRETVIERFRRFVHFNLLPYQRAELPVNFNGGVAHHFGSLLTEAVTAEGLQMGSICQSPMPGLLAYHGIAPQKWK